AAGRIEPHREAEPSVLEPERVRAVDDDLARQIARRGEGVSRAVPRHGEDDDLRAKRGVGESRYPRALESVDEGSILLLVRRPDAERDLVPRLREPPAKRAADCSRSHDCYLHTSLPYRA